MAGNKIALVSLSVTLLLLLGCAAGGAPDGGAATEGGGNAGAGNATGNGTGGMANTVQKVEVIHFHGTHQCYSCITVGDYAGETVNRYFAREMAEGKVTFAHVNAELPENWELAEKYGVASASLWIGVYDDAGFHKEQNTKVWYKISNREEYMSYLKGIIEKRLDGDFS